MLPPFFDMNTHFLRRLTRDALVDQGRRAELLSEILGAEPRLRITSLADGVEEPDVQGAMEPLLWYHVLGPSAFLSDGPDGPDPAQLPVTVEASPTDSTGMIRWTTVEAEGPTRVGVTEYELLKPLWDSLKNRVGPCDLTRSFSTAGRSTWIFWIIFNRAVSPVDAEEVARGAVEALKEAAGQEMIVRHRPLSGDGSFRSLPYGWTEAGTDWSGMLLRPIPRYRLLLSISPKVSTKVRVHEGQKTTGATEPEQARLKAKDEVNISDLDVDWTAVFHRWEEAVGSRAVRAGEVVSILVESLPKVAAGLGNTDQLRAVRLGGELRKLAIAGVPEPFALQARASGHGTRFVLTRNFIR